MFYFEVNYPRIFGKELFASCQSYLLARRHALDNTYLTLGKKRHLRLQDHLRLRVISREGLCTSSSLHPAKGGQSYHCISALGPEATNIIKVCRRQADLSRCLKANSVLQR